MNERLENDMSRRIDYHEGKRGHGRIWAGLILLLVGALLLLRSTNMITLPTWFFTWPVLLITIGLVSGIRHRFRGPFWFILVLIGGFGLADKIDPALQLDRYIWPVIFMALGLLFILKPKKSRGKNWYGEKCPNPAHYVNNPTDADSAYADPRDVIDVTAVFGGVKKNVLSKNFKGGDIVSFMGGSEINLTQADFNGRITIDATNIFGGTKLIVPPNWDVQSDITAVFGGVDDKRQVEGVIPDPQKVLILDGFCMFGGIEIRSF